MELIIQVKYKNTSSNINSKKGKRKSLEIRKQTKKIFLFKQIECEH